MENWKEIFASFGLWSLVDDISDDGDGQGDNLQLTKDGELFVSEIQQELDKAREEEFEKGKIAGRLEALPITIEEVNKARKGAKKEESKKLYQSISKELYKLYSDIEYSGDLRDEVYNLSDKYEKLSKLTTK